MGKLMEQVKVAGQDIDKSLQNIDKDYEPVDKIQEPEKENKNEKDVKNNFEEDLKPQKIDFPKGASESLKRGLSKNATERIVAKELNNQNLQKHPTLAKLGINTKRTYISGLDSMPFGIDKNRGVEIIAKNEQKAKENSGVSFSDKKEAMKITDEYIKTMGFSDPKDFEIQNFSAMKYIANAGKYTVKGAKAVGSKIAKITRKIDPDINDSINVIMNDAKITLPKIKNNIKDKSMATYIGLKYSPKESTKYFVKEYLPKKGKDASNFIKDKKQKIYKLMTDSEYRKKTLTFDNINKTIEKVASRVGTYLPVTGSLDASIGIIYANKKAQKAAQAVKYGYDIKRDAVKSAFAKDIAGYFNENNKSTVINLAAATGTGYVVGNGIKGMDKATGLIWQEVIKNGKKYYKYIKIK